jgi:ligand-binding sensor domain-containing protein
VGTFNDGLFVLDAWPSSEGLEHARPVATPFRMVNDALEVEGVLYVAANEGLFATTDGTTFARVREVGARGVTAVAYDGRSLYATTTSALWRVRLGNGGPPSAVWWKPAGSRSLQGVVTEHDRVWMASEDRGAILFDGKKFTAFDRLFGLPTSWVVAITGDGHGGAFGATLRDGAFHVDRNGQWQPMQGLPSAWTLSIARTDREVCVGTQEGAACYASPRANEAPWSAPSPVDGLPDSRVHAFLAQKASLLVGTEAGMAVRPRSML